MLVEALQAADTCSSISATLSLGYRTSAPHGRNAVEKRARVAWNASALNANQARFFNTCGAHCHLVLLVSDLDIKRLISIAMKCKRLSKER